MHRRCSYPVHTKIHGGGMKIHKLVITITSGKNSYTLAVWHNHEHIHTIRSLCLITCSAATNWIVLTSARDFPGGKLNLTVSMKCALSIWISTNTYSILIPAVESMGTVGERRQKKGRWIIESVMSGRPAVYTLLMVVQTLRRSACPVIQLYRNTVKAHI